MGQKTNPIGLARRHQPDLGFSRWFAERDYAGLLHEDLQLRKYLMDRLGQAGISRVVIERPAKKARITIHTARPGVVIGKKGADIEKLRQDLSKMTGGEVTLNIVEIRKPEIDAKLVAENIAQQLERRVAFRRAMKRAVQSAMRLGAQGIRINCGGRLGGAEIARDRVVSRRPRAAAHAARRCRFRHRDGQDHLRHLRREGLGLQGRDRWPTTRWRRTSAPRNSRRAAAAKAARTAGAKDKIMLSPKRTKFRKAHKGRIHGTAKGGTELNFGAYRPEGRRAGAASPRARSRPRAAPSPAT